jgi:uncharacterized OB-fold protein
MTPANPVTAQTPIRAAADRLKAAGESRPRAARDPVNLPMIRNWIEAIDPQGPCDPDTAPPAMIQVWTMPGLPGAHADDDPLGQMTQVLDDMGFTSVVATNCDQTYRRYLKVGEQLSVRARLLDVTGPKRTALGEGWFVTTRSTWFSAGEPVATMDFRILKYRPAPAPAATTPAPATTPATATTPAPATTSAPATAMTPATATTAVTSDPVLPMRPQVTPDTAFFWAGTAVGELRIQRCAGCGALRHPPGPMCPACGTPGDGGYVVAAGTGEVYSYVVHHHPPVPGKTLPLVVALVQLPEGVRMVGEMPGLAPDQVRIGLPVRATFLRVDDDLALPAWLCLPGGTALPPPGGSGGTPSPRTLRADPAARPAEGTLPDRVIDVTPTFVVASALATRDFYAVHHDRDRAQAQGAKDIFVNILTTIGLVQRYVCDWAPDAVVRAISIRLGVPCHAGDKLTLSGQVTAAEGAEQVVSVTGRCALGDHVTGTVRIERPR